MSIKEEMAVQNPRSTKPDWPAVVVTGASQTGVNLMRDLTRRGVSVYCVDRKRGCAFRSVYGTAFMCPNPDDEPAAWLSFMIDLSQTIGSRPVLMSSADQYVSAIAQHAEELDPFFIFSKSAAPIQALLATKERQYELASSHGMPVSRTRFVRTADEITEFGATAEFPCLLKPLHARHWGSCPENHPLHDEKLVLANTPEELTAQYRLAAEINPEMVVQEVIEGPDTAKLVYLSCYGSDGRRLGACIVRELRTTPIGYGSASVVEPISDPEVDSLCDTFLRNLKYSGLCEIELKRDSRDGIVKMIEANPRFSGTGDAAPYAGIPLGWLHYLDLIGQPVVPVEAHNRDFRHIVLQWDIQTIGSYMSAGLLSWRSLIHSYRPPVVFCDFNLRDWRLSLSTLGYIFRVLIGTLVRRVFPKRPKKD